MPPNSAGIRWGITLGTYRRFCNVSGASTTQCRQRNNSKYWGNGVELQNLVYGRILMPHMSPWQLATATDGHSERLHLTQQLAPAMAHLTRIRPSLHLLIGYCCNQAMVYVADFLLYGSLLPDDLRQVVVVLLGSDGYFYELHGK